jgi:hypothetical protein
MYEHRHQPLVPWPQFYLRILWCGVITGVCYLVTILIGAVAFHVLERLSWVDALLNAVLVMTGLGLTVTLETTAAKIFTGFYAVISAIVFFAGIAVLFSPLLHRALHHFHLDLEKNK